MTVKWTVSCLIGSMRISLQDQEISLVPHYLQWAMRTADSETWLSPSAFSLVKSRHTFEMLLQRTYPTLSLHIQVCKNMMHRFSREYSSGIAWVALSVCLHMYKLTVLQLLYAVGTMILPTWQMGTLRHRKVKWPAQVHTAKWQS